MSRNSKNLILGLSIGTNFVKAAIGSQSKNGKIEILSTGLAKQLPEAMRSGAILDASAVADACGRAIDEAEENADVSVRSVVVSFSNKLIKSSISRVHYTRSDSERPFSEEELDLITDKIEKNAEEKAASEIAFETDNENIEVALLNSELTSFIIDGEKTSDPIGTEGSDVVLEFFTSFGPRSQIRLVERICEELKLDLIKVTTDPFAIACAVLGAGKTSLTTMVVDIGSTNTNLSIIEKGDIHGIDTFNIGTKAIEKDLSVWISGLKITLGEFPHVNIIPENLILCGGGAENSDLQEYLALGNWFNDLPFYRRPTIQTLEKSDIADVDGDFDASFITPVGLVKIGFESN